MSKTAQTSLLKIGAHLGEFFGDIFFLAYEQFQFQRLSEIEQRLSKITNQSFQILSYLQEI